MDLIIAIIVGVVILSLVLWAIHELAPASLKYPLRILAIAAFVIWLLLRAWPTVAGLL